jgi:Zn-dependent peptidase ImmA (M78 family)
MASLANQDRFAIAAKDARDLFEKTNGHVPVDVCRIARILGYRVEEAEIRWAGYLAPGDNIIVVRRSDIPTRKRFTVAHEIGHLLWWKACGESVKEKRLYKGRGNSEEERIANRLASELWRFVRGVCQAHYGT